MQTTEATTEEECCAICFEQRPFMTLPCSCRINYCAACWDRALATSITVRGAAQCPSCRTAFRIDFDASAGELVFSNDPNGTAQHQWRSRLYGKAKPVQIKLLRDYGTSLTGRQASGTSCRKACCARLPAAEAEAGSLEARSSKIPEAGARELPACVCGAHLEHVTSRDRILRMLEDTDNSWRVRTPEFESLVEKLLSSSFVTCDICDQVATRSGALWTCKNGPHTVLHPASYDVCERCFARYAGARPEAKEAGCGQTFAAAWRALGRARGQGEPPHWRARRFVEALLPTAR